MRIEHPRPEQYGRLKSLWMDAFGDSGQMVENFFSRAFSPERCRCIPAGEEIAAALYWMDVHFAGRKLAYIYAVATHRNFRGRGLCRQLMADTHALLEARDYAAALLYPASEGLRRMYAAFDYRDCCRSAAGSCPAGVPVALRQITPVEYYRLRRQYLPAGSVIQGVEQLEFFGSYGSFLQGADFLAAAVRDGERLVIQELLGEASRAPGIAAALGCESCTWRGPGQELETAMVYPFGNLGTMPGYMGLLLD